MHASPHIKHAHVMQTRVMNAHVMHVHITPPDMHAHAVHVHAVYCMFSSDFFYDMEPVFTAVCRCQLSATGKVSMPLKLNSDMPSVAMPTAAKM
jgi:hypothetical protein